MDKNKGNFNCVYSVQTCFLCALHTAENKAYYSSLSHEKLVTISVCSLQFVIMPQVFYYNNLFYVHGFISCFMHGSGLGRACGKGRFVKNSYFTAYHCTLPCQHFESYFQESVPKRSV